MTETQSSARILLELYDRYTHDCRMDDPEWRHRDVTLRDFMEWLQLNHRNL